jgi:hypothetical protein
MNINDLIAMFRAFRPMRQQLARRARVRGKANPAGSKLARKALEGKLGSNHGF